MADSQRPEQALRRHPRPHQARGREAGADWSRRQARRATGKRIQFREGDMRAILIDPIPETITEIEFNRDYRHIYTLLSDQEHNVAVGDFNIVRITGDHLHGDDIYVDGEGLLKEPRYFFMWRGYPTPLAGRGLIIAHNGEGESIATTLQLEDVRRMVRFVQLSLEGMDQSIRHGVVRPELGPEPITVIKSTPV